MTLAFALLEEHILTPAAIVMSPIRFKDMRNWKDERFVELKKGSKLHRATFLDVPVYVSIVCPKNAVYVLAPAEYVGVFIEREAPSKTDVVEAEKDRQGFVYGEKVGIGVINELCRH